MSQLECNLEIYRRYLTDEAKIMAVVKADAYGHGDVAVSKKLSQIGVDLFAVSNIDEAIILRESGIKGEILVLGYTPVELAPELLKYDITQALLSEAYAEQLLSFSSEIKCQFAIDTGMNRIGVKVEESAEVIKKYATRCNLNGFFTHLCAADSIESDDLMFTNRQIRKFEHLMDIISDLNLQYIHCLNSAGGFYQSPNCKCDNIVRLGIVMYGLRYNQKIKLPEGIQPVLTWKTVVSLVKTIERGECVGYGRSFCAEQKMKIATLPVGYADGYNRQLSNRGYVMIKGQKARIVGRVCMDQTMVDVTHIEGVLEGDEVTLIGNGIDADTLASMVGTIGYEIVCSISKRVPRIYI
ncbi:MAG: alanine racemase [Clostridia bacterium]|nr:alanine racemase [Clostridia bacterium]